MNSLSLFVRNKDLGSDYSFLNLSLLNQGKKEENWYLIEDLQKIFVTYFKSMYSLISKAKYNVSAEKITIKILYYITIPDANIFTWYMIFNKNSSKINQGLSSSSMQTEDQGRKNKKLGFLKRKNKLINLLKKKIRKIRQREKIFELNLKSINYLYESKFYSLTILFNIFIEKPIEFLLIRLHHSDAESNILAQLVLLVLKKKNIRRIINKLYNKRKVKDINKMKFSINKNFAANDEILTNNNFVVNNILKSSAVYLSGLYIHIGGRLMREPIIPRRTTKKFEKGAIALGKVNSLEETSITKKNRKGAYTIKIIFAQNILS